MDCTWCYQKPSLLLISLTPASCFWALFFFPLSCLFSKPLISRLLYHLLYPISDILYLISYISRRSHRSSDQGLLVVPCSLALKTEGDCAFEVVAQTLWNAFPLGLRSAVTADEKAAKDSFIQLAFVLPHAV